MKQTNVRTIIGRNIKRHRVLRGLSQKALGEHLGITFQQIQKYETGANGISCEKLLQLATLFQCSLDDICRSAGDPVPVSAAEYPWDSYKTHLLITHFNRIRSHAIRDKICGMVGAIADIASGNAEDAA